MQNKFKLFNKNIEIGRVFFPADFKYINDDLLKKLSSLDCEERFAYAYEYFCELSPEKSMVSAVFNNGLPFSTIMFDENLASINLTEGKTATYLDVISNCENVFLSVCSIISVFLCSYIDLTQYNFVKHGAKVNVFIPSNDGVFALAFIIAKKCGAPIANVVIGCDSVVNSNDKSVNFIKVNNSDIDDYLYDFFDEYDMVLDPLSVKSMLAYEEFLDNFKSNVPNLSIIVASPYYFARQIVKSITEKAVLSPEKAINVLYEETAQEIPEIIENGKVYFFTPNVILPYEILVEFLKELNIV